MFTPLTLINQTEKNAFFFYKNFVLATSTSTITINNTVNLLHARALVKHMKGTCKLVKMEMERKKNVKIRVKDRRGFVLFTLHELWCCRIAIITIMRDTYNFYNVYNRGAEVTKWFNPEIIYTYYVVHAPAWWYVMNYGWYNCPSMSVINN